MPSQSLNHSHTQSLDLRTAIAPQMQQSLNVLQASTLELNQMIGQELSANPVLEEESVEISLEEEKLDDKLKLLLLIYSSYIFLRVLVPEF